ncbi:MAG TPA: NADH-quinone oxidoreductase subunit L [Candidatus Dormibacteraeota bacterium]|nr:NADH-quinone oxidoreductase subunit L [Candidatus Dormibacteraeota bacterium]
MSLVLLAAAAKGPLDTWSPTLFGLFALLLPLTGLVIILAFTIDSRRLSQAIAVLFTLGAVLCALLMLAIELAHPQHLERVGTYLQFFTGQSGAASEFSLQWGVLADPLASVVLVMVALVSLFVQLYALSFIRREDDPIRFFGLVLFTTFAMTGVVLSVTLFEMLIFLGLVTLSSYLLIGYWWQREGSGSASLLAFGISAFGDVALLVATAYLYFRFTDLNFQGLANLYANGYLNGRVGANGLFLIALLVLIAAAAKSALFPLHVWLPRSAQAPAPAAALIHSAGAALCGVYLIARMYALFHASPRALALLAVVGGLTALLGALFALFQDNLKRAIAYTTMAELGLMVLGLGISAYGAAVFEAFTQAWPKALLFLAAGVIIRELRTERMGEMGGLWRRMPFASWMLLIAVAAAAGVPPLSTFWSKDAILSKALAISSVPAVVVGTAVTLIGAIALARIFCLVSTGETARRRRFEPERIRDASGRMAFAMVLFAIGSVVGGAIRVFRGHIDPIAFVSFPGVVLANSHLLAAGVTAVAAVAGVAIGWLIYGPRLVPVTALQPLRPSLTEGLFVDQAYGQGVRLGVLPLSRGLGWVDRRVVDGALDLVADSLAFASRPRRWLGELHTRQLAIGVVAAVLALALVSIVLTGRLIGTT